MPLITPRALSGFADYTPEEQARFDAILGRVRRSFELFGFSHVDSPLLDDAAVLLAKSGGETEKQIYRLSKGEHDLAVRFDLTVPLAKYIALHAGNLNFPFRAFQIGRVYRGERAQRGRFREFYQCDIDIIGDGALSVINDAEVPAAMYHTLTSVGLSGFQIRVNNRKLLNGLFAILGAADKSAGIMRTIDKIDKIGKEKTLALLTSEENVPEDTASALIGIISGETPLDGYIGKDALFDEGYEQLRQVTAYLKAFGVPEDAFRVDLTIARGLVYYTGSVYETTILKHPEIGSICSGGRYDNLAGYYTDRKLPGVGMSIGLTRLVYVLGEQGYLNGELSASLCDVIVLPMTENLSYAANIAALFRSKGLKTALYGENKKFKAKMTYASKIGARFAVIIGEDEISTGRVTVKDLQTGEQVTAGAEVLAVGVRDKVAETAEIKPVKM